VKSNKSHMKSSATVEVGNQASTERTTTGMPLEEKPLVRTLPQELSSLQLTGEPVMVQRKKTLRRPTKAPEETEESNCCPTG